MTDLRSAATWLDVQLQSVGVSVGPPAAGTRADQPDRLGDLVGVVQSIAAVLADVHSLSTGDFSATVPDVAVGWEGLAARIESRPTIDTSTLPAPYDRYDHSTLRRLWIEGRPSIEDLVVCHGQPELAMVGFGDGRITGLGIGPDVAPMVADRHLDLAVVHQSIVRNFGAEAIFPFYDAYPTAPDLVRLDHYVLATFLL